MTIIVWDGTTLAADRGAVLNGHLSPVTKIFRVPGGLVGFSGKEGHAAALLHWFLGGRDADGWPKPFGTEAAMAIYVTPAGVHLYTGEDGPNAALYTSNMQAWGCGRDFALAALYLGCNAKRAAEVTCALDIYCGCGVDTLVL